MGTPRSRTAKRYVPRVTYAPRDQGGLKRLRTSLTLHPDIFADGAVLADAHGISLGRLAEIGLARILEEHGHPQPPERLEFPPTRKPADDDE